MKITDDIFKSIFNEGVWISITISLKFVPKGPIDYKSALVQVMAWHRTGKKPLPESMLTKFTDAIQIKICAEYRDMLPRPRLVCQEPGLRPIGRSPGVPDKSSRGLGSMSRYSAEILICFIAYIFLIFFHSSVGLVGNFAGLPVCTVPSAIVHCNQNEAGHQTIKAPSMPCWDAAGPSKHSLAFKSQPGENDR